jgi:hypothetical protein
MVIYFDIIDLVRNCMVVNELKSPYENMAILKNSLLYMLKNKIEIHPKMIMIWTYENMAHFKPFKSP